MSNPECWYFFLNDEGNQSWSEIPEPPFGSGTNAVEEYCDEHDYHHLMHSSYVVAYEKAEEPYGSGRFLVHVSIGSVISRVIFIHEFPTLLMLLDLLSWTRRA